MIGPVPRRSGGGGRRRPLAAAAVLVVLAATGLVGAAPATGAPERIAVTGGCRAVGSSDAPTGGGPDRATVVVDTGSGPVWSACVSFSGSISGVEALERAEDVITDLDPVYDQYTGLGKAICKLRGVGTAPPDCLGKSTSSWWLSINGKISPRGAAQVTLGDGDVEGWKYGTGGLPRAATAGTEAAAAPPVTTTKPPTPTTQPPVATTKPGGGLTGATTPDGKPVASTTTKPGETTTTKPGETTTTAKGATTTTKAGDDDVRTTQLAGSDEDGDGDGDGEDAAGGASESASKGSSSNAAALGDDAEDDGSSLPAILGFVALIAAIGGGVVFVRRRNAAGPTPS